MDVKMIDIDDLNRTIAARRNSDSSEDSSLEYMQEPYEEWKHRVLGFAVDVFQLHPASIRLDRIRGGSYNRVIGITTERPSLSLRNWGKKDVSQYVLRVPRDGPLGMDYHIAILQFVAGKISYPVPQVLAYDMTERNGLTQAYMIQPRFPGKQLDSLWNTLNLDQKKSAAQAISHLLLELHSITNPTPGVVSISKFRQYAPGCVRTNVVPVPRDDWSENGFQCEPCPISLSRFPVMEYLHELCDRQRDCHMDGETDMVAYEDIWMGFHRIIRHLQTSGVLPPKNEFHLFHGDLYPRNILVETVSKSEVKITGVIDWDLASFAPAFMTTRAPFFLWADDIDLESFEEEAMTTPRDQEGLELKRTFERVVGPLFVRMAYDWQLIFAREMYYTLSCGIRNDEDAWLIEENIKEYITRYPDAEHM